MRYLLAVVLTLFTLLSQAQEYAPQKVVYHINDGDRSRFAHTLTNITNHINAVGEERIDLRAVVHGAAIEIFMAANDDPQLAISIDAARFLGAQFIICGNSLTGYNIGYQDLYDVEAEDVVQAGLPEIVRLQQEGFFYVRP